MKAVAILISAVALVMTMFFPPLVVITCPTILLALLGFVRSNRFEREALEEQRHQELLEAARYPRSG